MQVRNIMGAAALSLVSAGAVSAAELSITLTNLTGGMHFTPQLLVAHTADVDVFEVGSQASSGLATLAEGGDTSVLGADLDTTPANSTHATVEGLLAPATTTAVQTFNTEGHAYLSVVAMLLPTNDAFVGLDSWAIPSSPGTYHVTLNAYDAGSEANDEIINGAGALGVVGIPAAPGGNAGTGGTGVTATEANSTVHIHRGQLGDSDPTGGVSDVDSSIHRWLNPVARLTVTVN